MWFRYANRFGRAESIYSLVEHALAVLRCRVPFLDRRRHHVSVLVERRA
jgi:hypothetical protein